MAKSNSVSKTAVWILMGLLILGLAGFGATNLSGNLRTVGFVGDKPISVDSYFRAMQQELQAAQAETGQALRFQEARALGLDQAVLNRLITVRALDHEAAELGLSVGDAIVRDQILQIGAFQSLNGTFDREAYAFALRQQGLTESEFETQLREEVARTLLQSAVVNGVTMPSTLPDMLVSYIGEARSFTWAPVTTELLEALPDAPSEEVLRAYYDANPELFTLPASKRITYVALTPDMLIDTVEVDDAALRQAYEERAAEFAQPERRLVERLVFLDAAAAEAAAARVQSGEATFETLVEERGLALADTDLGDVAKAALGEAGAAVFAAEVGEVVGPLPADIGPALFRVNGVLAAQETSFEDARAGLREGLALDRARRVIEAQAQDFDDLLAGGATLEELAGESDLELGQIDWTEETAKGIAAYEDFRSFAMALEPSDFPQITLLEDGGVFAARLDEALPERPEPFEAARDAVAEAVRTEQTADALEAAAQALLPQLAEGGYFTEAGLRGQTEVDMARGAFVPGAPPSLLEAVFDMQPGDVQIVRGGGMVVVARLISVSPASESAELAPVATALRQQMNQALAQDLFDIYTNEVALRAGPRIDRQSVEAVNVNFP